MSDPVIASDGYTYEREAIEEWMRHQGTSPISRQPLVIIRANEGLKLMIDGLCSPLSLFIVIILILSSSFIFTDFRRRLTPEQLESIQ